MTQKLSIFNKAIRNENSFIELFHNFLQFEDIKAGFLELLGIPEAVKDLNLIKTNTQDSLGENGQPDLSLSLEKELYVLIEIKVYNTHLTPNQPSSYYDQLKNTSSIKHKGLILLAPKYYAHKKQYLNRLKIVEDESSGIFTRIVQWEEIVDMIESLDQTSNNILYQEYLNFIRNWCNHYPQFLTQKQSQTMYSKESGEAFFTSIKLVHRIYKNLAEKGIEVVSVKAQNLLDDFDEYGFYIKIDNQPDLFFGIWLAYWADSGKPFCLCSNSKDSDFLNELKYHATGHGFGNAQTFNNWTTLPLNQETVVSEKAEEEIGQLLSEIYATLNAKA